MEIFSVRGYEFYSAQFALIPVELAQGNIPGSEMIHPWLSVLTYMFSHGSIGHLLFNMLFLWIFGNNVEDSMSRFSFMEFYVIVGIISGLAFAFMHPESQAFLVGASGAISGVLGAYLFLYPLARVHAIFFIFPIRMPAFIFIILWFVTQISGFLGGGGNVAWVTHIAGFLSGAVLFRLFVKKKQSE